MLLEKVYLNYYKTKSVNQLNFKVTILTSEKECFVILCLIGTWIVTYSDTDRQH